MDAIESQVALLLEGKPYEEMVELCDFSLSDQNEAAMSKGVTQLSVASDYKPVVKKSVTYIVAAVLFNDDGDVLMMQVGRGKREQFENIFIASRRKVFVRL